MEKKLETNDDEKLVDSFVHNLDKSLEDIDEVNLQKLKKLRKKAIVSSTNVLPGWINLRIAAGLAVLMLIPLAGHQYSQSKSFDQGVEIVSQEIPYSVEEMDDIEMLMALEDSDA